MPRRRLPLAIAVLALATSAVLPAALGPAARAQEAPAVVTSPGAAAPPAAPATTPSPAEAAAARRAEAAAERSALEAQLAALPGGAETNPQLAREIDRLKRIERLIDDQIEALGRGQDLAQAVADSDRRLAEGARAGLAKDPPYPIALLDVLLDAYESQHERSAALESAITASATQLDEARRTLDERETARRQAKEAAEQAGPDAAGAAARQALREAELASRRAKERVALEELQLANVRRDRELQQKAELLIGDAVDWVETNIGASSDELAGTTGAIEQREFSLRDDLDAARSEQKSAERRVTAVQKRVDAAPEPAAALTAELEARRLEESVARRRVLFFEQELARLAELRELWDRRVRALRGDLSRGDLRVWEDQIRQAECERARDRRLAESRLAELRLDLQNVRGRLQALALPGGPAEPGAPPAEAAPEQRWLADQERQLGLLIDSFEEEIAGLAESDRLARRTLRAVGERRQQPTLAERLGDAREGISKALGSELLAVDDRSITVGKVLGALLLFGLGYVFSKWFAQLAARLAGRRLALDEGATTAIESLAFYGLLVLLFLVALRTVNIPLTAFAVLGGALAIGVGFGSQTIVNNFVSGIILMVERPIKVGDVVLFDGSSGRVERIGPRSTRIRTFDNIHMIVPNSKLLENNVINWTLADDLVRTRIRVGVAYGSPTREVERLLGELIAANPGILENPAPVVLLTGFGESSIDFQADFWVRMGLVDMRVIESDLRHAIDAAFRAHGIEIAFPRRDVHLVSSPAPEPEGAP